mmetsp:Transcript_55893/g.154788  ORF Transcript_55893/g.154788 Transcript_55893/m.154788 type:complete len:384 (-) Transcript_55893:553-1704(-)
MGGSQSTRCCVSAPRRQRVQFIHCCSPEAKLLQDKTIDEEALRKRLLMEEEVVSIGKEDSLTLVQKALPAAGVSRCGLGLAAKERSVREVPPEPLAVGSGQAVQALPVVAAVVAARGVNGEASAAAEELAGRLAFAERRCLELQAEASRLEAARTVPRSPEEDSPGFYVLTAPCVLSTGAESSSPKVQELRAGRVVQVIEVAHLAVERRVRGLIACPMGWITLVDVEEATDPSRGPTPLTSPRFLRKVSLGSLTATLESKDHSQAHDSEEPEVTDATSEATTLAPVTPGPADAAPTSTEAPAVPEFTEASPTLMVSALALNVLDVDDAVAGPWAPSPEPLATQPRAARRSRPGMRTGRTVETARPSLVPKDDKLVEKESGPAR